eukprot:TRINITY_DN4714_c0_g2_i13.p3 TRINITY_DN4714_c0_g2~~TRINITY_DN4714_c0_g2_i13.p3  ORF type:complete len:282 (+),score=58.48 TRINITY_DN4714_c0_g2_i13:264-1109(+)
MQASLHGVQEAAPEVYKFCNLMSEALISQMLHGLTRIARSREQGGKGLKDMVRTRDWRQQIMQIQKQEEKDAQERTQANKQQYLEMAKRARKMDDSSKQQVERLKKEQEQQKSLELANQRLRGLAGGVKRKTGNASMDFIAKALGGGGLNKKRKLNQQKDQNNIGQITQDGGQQGKEQKMSGSEAEDQQNMQQQIMDVKQDQQVKVRVENGVENQQLGIIQKEGDQRRGQQLQRQRVKQQKYKVQLQDVLSYFEHEHGFLNETQQQLLYAKIWEQQAQQQQ